MHIDNTLDSDTTGSVIKLSSNSDGCVSAIGHIQVDENDSDLAFYTDNAGTLTEAMRIDNSQNVGIGTNSPTTQASVGTFLEISAAYHPGWIVIKTDIMPKIKLYLFRVFFRL